MLRMLFAVLCALLLAGCAGSRDEYARHRFYSDNDLYESSIGQAGYQQVHSRGYYRGRY